MELIKRSTNPHGEPVGMFYSGTLRINGRQTFVVVRLTKAGAPMKQRTSGHRITFDPYYKPVGRVLSIMSREEAEKVWAAQVAA